VNISLHGRRALVTGASRGIGAAAAEALAAAGAEVFVNYHSSRARAEELCARIAAAGGRATPLAADVGQLAEIRRMFDALEAAGGPVDILVNNAGIEIRHASADFDEATYDAILNTNLKGAFFCAQRALTHMRARGWGRVINISSVHEETATGFCSPYAMSKGGMRMMMRELAREYARDGITVNNIAPGAIRTDINREVLADPAYEAKVNARIPAGFIGEPQDVAQLVVYVASDAARYINGTSLFIDGGLSL